MADRGHLTWRAPLQWAALPVIYFAYVLQRASFDGHQPYPFMNLLRLGWPQTILNAGAMAACFVGVGFIMVLLDRRPRTEAVGD